MQLWVALMNFQMLCFAPNGSFALQPIIIPPVYQYIDDIRAHVEISCVIYIYRFLIQIFTYEPNLIYYFTFFYHFHKKVLHPRLKSVRMRYTKSVIKHHDHVAILLLQVDIQKNVLLGLRQAQFGGGSEGLFPHWKESLSMSKLCTVNGGQRGLEVIMDSLTMHFLWGALKCAAK